MLTTNVVSSVIPFAYQREDLTQTVDEMDDKAVIREEFKIKA